MAWLCLLLVAVMSDFDHEVRYAVALRTEGLHRLAELQCQRLLQDEQLSETQRVEANIQLSKTLADLALDSRPPIRDEYWTRSFAAINAGLGNSQSPSSRVLLQLQLGLAKLERAEWTRREADVQAQNDDDWNDSRTQLRESISLLKKVEEELTRPRMRAGNEGISSPRVAELLRNTNYQLSRAYRNQAITYARRPRDMIAALNRALAKLQPIAGETAADELVWNARIDRIQCLRLRGDLEPASQLIAGASDAPADKVGRLAAEAVRLALDAKRPESALKMLQSQQEASKAHPELELARIETLVALATDEQDVAQQKNLQGQAARVAAELTQIHGNYWGLRGEMLIARLADRPGAQGDTKLLDTAANTLLKQDSPEQATDMFIRGARQAEADGQPQQAFDFRYKAATIDHQQGNLQAAIDRYRDVSLVRYPENPRAAEAHLLAIFDAAALYQQYARSQESAAAEKLAQYDALLREHLAQWPTATSANQARVWFGRLAEAQRKTAEAIDAYRGVQAGSEHAAEAYRRLGDLYAKQFQRQPGGNSLKEAREWMSRRYAEERGSPAAVTLASQIASLSTRFAPYDYAAADLILRATQSQIRDDSDDKASLAAWSVVAAAGGNDTARAKNLLSSSLPLPADALMSVVRGLQPVRESRPNDTELRALVLECVELLRPYFDRLTESDRLLLKQVVADAASQQDALQAYTEFATANPKDARIQRKYAELLAMGRDRASREAALKQWRVVVSLTRPRSAEWFRAKLGVAQAYFDKGDHSKTREVIELLTTLYPKMGGPELKQAFRDLLARCR